MERVSFLNNQKSQKMVVTQVFDDYVLACFSGIRMSESLGEPGKSGSCGCIKSLDPFLDVNRGLQSGITTNQIAAASTSCLRITGAVIAATFPNYPTGITGQPYHFFIDPSYFYYNGLNSPGSQYQEQKPVFYEAETQNKIITSAKITQTGLYCYKSTDTSLPNFFTIGVPTDYYEVNEYNAPGALIGSSDFIYSGYFLGTPIDINEEKNKNKGGPEACGKLVSISSVQVTSIGTGYTNPITIINNLTGECFTPRYREITPFEGNVLSSGGTITGIQTINVGTYCVLEGVQGENCDPAPTYSQLSFNFTGGTGILGQAIFTLVDSTTSIASGKGGFFDSSGRYCVEVAKPHALRKTPFHNQSVDNISYSFSDVDTRTATDVDGASNEEIFPRYKIGDEIYTSKSISDGTDISIATGSGNSSLFFMDENRDARHWRSDGGGDGGGAAVWL